MELLAEARRRLRELTERIERINQGNPVKAYVSMHSDPARIVVAVESRG
jgi:hypothetical protein